jgi:hypothetical protein
MAVRHGWLSGGETDRSPDLPQSRIDLPAFVASVLPADSRVPASWVRDLDGLPGFDRQTRTVRLTSDPDRLRDDQGQALLYPGRAHPLTRRAITAARTDPQGRVSAARGELSLLATYAVETSVVAFRQVFALRLFPDGSIRQETDWLRPLEAAPSETAWDRYFAGWVRMDRLQARAGDIATQLAACFAQDQAKRLDRDDETALAWLERRTNEICGPRMPSTGDLFDTEPRGTDWRSAARPHDRLAGFAADRSTPPAAGRDALQLLASFRDRPRPRPSAPALRHLGLLMLVP